MRLLDVHTLELYTFYGDRIPKYVILSHNWLADDQEVTFQQIQKPGACRHIVGFAKIELLCKQAKKDGYQYAWIDTCCIDKSSSSELSEAINSMFAWYKNAELCYAYLADVQTDGVDFLSSRWWTRAWTLQELLAPSKVHFFDGDWNLLGVKDNLDTAKEIARLTGIDLEVLRYPPQAKLRSIAQRMSWAAAREASRSEDLAYSLLGLFGIHMPMQYGEGEAAFVRLQKELLRITNDQTLFAWSPSLHIVEDSTAEPDHQEPTINSAEPSNESLYGIFAPNPRAFRHCNNLVVADTATSPISDMNGTIQMEMPLVLRKFSVSRGSQYYIGLLACTTTNNPFWMVALLLVRWNTGSTFRRVAFRPGVFTFAVSPRLATSAKVEKVYIAENERLLNAMTTILFQEAQFRRTIIVRNIPVTDVLHLTNASNGTTWNPETMTLNVRSPGQNLIHLGFDIVSGHTISTLHVEIGLRLDTRPDAIRDRIIIFESGTPSGFGERLAHLSADAPSTTASLTRDAKIEATVKTRRIFNHLITDLNIDVRRYERSGLGRA